jgi:hypothetical protein
LWLASGRGVERGKGRGRDIDDIESLQAATEAAILFHIADAHCTTYNAQQFIHFLELSSRRTEWQGKMESKRKKEKEKVAHPYIST